MNKTKTKTKNNSAQYYSIYLRVLFTLYALIFSLWINTVTAKDVTQSVADVKAGDALASNPPTAVLSTPPVVAYKPVIPATQQLNTSSQLISLLGGLAFIVALIWGLSWFVKRFSQGGFMKSSAIKILATMPLGTRERLMLVEVGGKHILLGVTASQINTLHVFEQPIANTDKKHIEPSDFSNNLMAVLQQKNLLGSNDPDHKKNQQ